MTWCLFHGSHCWISVTSSWEFFALMWYWADSVELLLTWNCQVCGDVMSSEMVITYFYLWPLHSVALPKWEAVVLQFDYFMKSKQSSWAPELLNPRASRIWGCELSAGGSCMSLFPVTGLVVRKKECPSDQYSLKLISLLTGHIYQGLHEASVVV